MIKDNEIIDGKYLHMGTCSKSGGMGTIIFVESLTTEAPFSLVLKYCNNATPENLKRFKREVRLLASFKDNSKVAQVFDHNLEYEPPYFVMKYYADGDLMSRSHLMQESLEDQEKTILQMIDCIQELHSRNEFHRDIKPQNFLLDDNQILVSDFGLITEVGSETAFTSSSVAMGTLGYIPPEFFKGNFKNADATGDIFMLGKTIYVLLTKKDPMYMEAEGIPAPLFYILERCCSVSKEHRYQTLADLKQAVVSAYDVLIGRSGGIGKVKQLLSAINDRIEQEQQYRASEVKDFIEQLALIETSDQIQVCFELPDVFFRVIRQKNLLQSLPVFLSIYDNLIESQNYSWSYAETIAKNMKDVFSGEDAPNSQKARALDMAIRGAIYMNRFAAMTTCSDMITAISDETLGMQIAPIFMKFTDSFISRIEPSECKSTVIANTLRTLQTSN